MSVAGNEGPNGGDRGLAPVEPPESVERTLGAPFAAMADALRANAEALQRIDSNQRKIAESIEKGDKAGQVITSTRALNETFRGLADIQRGLLDAVVSDKDRANPLLADLPSSTLSRAELSSGIELTELLQSTSLAKSKGEARRLINNGGVYINNVRESDAAKQVSLDDLGTETMIVLRSGKKKYHIVCVD